MRGFNGYAGGLHEYRLRTDENGLLVVNIDQGGRTGVAEWERITPDERNATYDRLGLDARGDPGYVDDVLRQSGF